MKRYLLIFSFLVSIATSKAQLYGNEWINTSQTYYKIKVSSDGIYRIPGTLLPVELSTKQASSFAMYHNGQQVPLYISVLPDSVIKANDYIEFYGEKNRGYIDSLLYDSAAHQINPDLSLFTNTSVYFLTTNGLPNNLRLELEPYNNNPHPPKEEFFMHKSLMPLTYVYYEGEYYQSGRDELYMSRYDPGEGYANFPFFFNGSPQSFTIPTPSVYAQGPNAILRTYFTNNSTVGGQNHLVRIKLNGSNLAFQPNPVHGFQLNRWQLNILSAQLGNGSNTINFSDEGTPPSYSQRANVVGFIELEYPRQYNFGGETTFYFRITKDPANKKYLEISNFNSNNTKPLLYDLTNGKIYVHNDPAGTALLRFQILPSGTDRHMYLRSDDAYSTVTEIAPVTFVDYSINANQGDYFIISNSALRNDGTGNDPVEEYRAYRDNKYTSKIADIELLYDQFGYGIRKSPLAIRNFINYARNTFSLKYVFIIGKGRESHKMRFDQGAYDQCLVPTFGYPGSDNLLSATRGSDTAHIAVGRLAAEHRYQVRDYLDKVRLYEAQQNTYTCDQAIEPKDWQKKVLHFSGGAGLGEQTTFKGYVYTYSQTATDTLWGADTASYSKTSTAPIEYSVSQVITNRINAGVSWITLFGHSSTNAFDFSIDEPQNYNNSPHFPIILSNGCFSGFIHDVSPGFSEKFVFQPNKAAIAFMATSSISVTAGLHQFSTKLYDNTCRKNYYQPLGKAFQQAYNDIMCCNSGNGAEGVAQQITLHGDPGLMVNQYPKPDYAIESSSVYFNPSTVLPGVDSFEVNVIITNLGKAINDSIAVTLRRVISDASGNEFTYNYRKFVPAPYYKDTVSFNLPVNISTLGYGQNLFYPYVDADFEIDEMAECNNGLTTAVTTYIQNDDIIPIYPYEFAIVPYKGVTLKASTINPFAPLRSYRFQIDTSELFINPLREGVVTQAGGVVHWPTDTALYNAASYPYTTDTTVFYWRVKKEDVSDSFYHYSSFAYIKDEYPGWNQSHYYQWKKDSYLNMYLDTDRIFKFPSTTQNIRVYTGIADAVSGGNLDAEQLGWYLNNAIMHLYRFGGCGYYQGGITFAVINNHTGQPWESHYVSGNNGPWGNIHCAGNGVQFGFDFPTGTDGWADAIKVFVDAIPCGYYVLLYSVNDPLSHYILWPDTLVNVLTRLGFPDAALFQNGTKDGPFVFFTQKCNLNYDTFFANSPPPYSQLDVNFDFTGEWNQGQITSPKIGPAVEWGSIHWKDNYKELPNYDRDTLDIIGIRNNSADTLLFSITKPDTLLIGPAKIDPEVYPYLQLRLRTRDDSLRTPTQLQYWRVLYKKPPEAAINPSAWFKLDTNLCVGQTLHFEIAVENVSEVDLDSILTKYSVRDAASGVRTYPVRYDTLAGSDTIILIWDLPLSDGSYVGTNKIIVEFNPDNDQLEQYHFNNIAEISFNVCGDKINPLLDVTFDNQHIMNGDIVSAKPNILIMLKDENKYLALDDQSLIDVYLKYPGHTTPTKIPYDNSVLTFYPADAANLARSNKAHVEFKPGLLTDGKYELMIKDRDRSGNNSSTDDTKFNGPYALDYQISFEVINKPMITNVLNYPNPFTTATKFIFTVTGVEVPDYLKIQIMTIKGTVVKEITKEELGDLHVGRNITQYTWDGRDQYGDLLANGVYFYHVSARLDDKRMDHMSQSYDKYFKKGFGKLVIIR